MSQNKSSENLVAEAIGGKHGATERLRNDMSKLAGVIAKRYVDPYTTIDELIPIGLTHFAFALKRYALHLKKAKQRGKKLYKFSTYYAWWITVSLKTYLGLTKNPVAGIPQKQTSIHEV